MRPTQTSRPVQNDSFPAFQLFILAIIRLSEPIALVSIFPYAWLMVKSFAIGSEDDASFYAGLLISAFSLTEAASGMIWGTVSDRIGRKPVMLIGCTGTMLSLLMVGFSRSFGVALAGRALGGLLNGNTGVIMTMVGEIVKNPSHEPRAFAIMPFVFSIGSIIGPAIGGSLANPVKGYPSLFRKGGFFDHFPWALPNLVCAALMLFSIILTYFFLEETHPDLCGNSETHTQQDVTETSALIIGSNTLTNPGVDLRRSSFGTFNGIETTLNNEWTVNADGSSRTSSISEKTSEKWLTKKIITIVVALGIYTYHSMCYDHLLPIFLQDKRGEELSILTTDSSPAVFHIDGGLGLETKTVGLIMSINGIIAMFIQAVIFPVVADRLGVFRTFMMVTILHPIAFFIVPYLAFLPEKFLFAGIYICLTIRQFNSILDYPSILIMLKQASPTPRYLGKINGLAASIGAASRMIAPPLAGLLYTKGRHLEYTGLPWLAAGLVAVVGIVQMFTIPRDSAQSASIKPLARCMSNQEYTAIPREVVDVIVFDDESDLEHYA